MGFLYLSPDHSYLKLLSSNMKGIRGSMFAFAFPIHLMHKIRSGSALPKMNSMMKTTSSTKAHGEKALKTSVGPLKPEAKDPERPYPGSGLGGSTRLRWPSLENSGEDTTTRKKSSFPKPARSWNL
ncbi:unnamed protein product [Lepeophtheirus salmonis]|uniref:(salmon louse) hypothetical protein n=1 Tax=Lepeophtheirus salmonis TaxID=72036 RepID=A0A7R8CKC8_LEPSM|nr:unnamed protein product [Lepeophtheirus salmonis]CAF2819224.1 unnamed protein product [Lepeophtheirus salmonis]